MTPARFQSGPNRNTADEKSISELIDFCAYFTDAVYDIIKPKIENHWGGFCMAADFGRAIVLSTGADGDDSLISLGNPANSPAKRLGLQPQVKSGHLALRADIASLCSQIKDVSGRYSVGSWIDVDVKDRPMLMQKSANATVLEEAIANSKTASLARDGRRIVALSANSAEYVETGGSSVRNPTFVQGFVLRADLDGFTWRVEAAFAQGNQQAIQNLVVEFLQIMKIPDAFEDYVGRPMIRLPWAGDCYNAIFLPKDHEDYDATRKALPAVVANHWLDLSGRVNQKRDEMLAKIAQKKNGASGLPAERSRRAASLWRISTPGTGASWLSLDGAHAGRSTRRMRTGCEPTRPPYTSRTTRPSIPPTKGLLERGRTATLTTGRPQPRRLSGRKWRSSARAARSRSNRARQRS